MERQNETPIRHGDRKILQKYSKMLGRIPMRYVFTILSCFGIINIYTMRINLSVGLVAMINRTAIQLTTNASTECFFDDTDNLTSISSTNDGEFAWDEYIQGIVLGSFYWGYMFTQLPGGRVAELYSAKWIFGGGVGITALLTLLTPVAARAGYWYLVAVRAIEGFAEGATYPSMNFMVSRWSTPNERSRMSTVIFSGALLGTVIGMTLTGYLAANGFAGGWPSVFYVFGMVGIVWFIFWGLFVYDDPEKHPCITEEELHYILKNSHHLEKCEKKSLKFPLKQVSMSMPVWAIIVSHFCNNWGFFTLLSQLPTYLSTILHYNIKTNGLLSAIPYLSAWIFSIICGSLCDLFIKRNYFSTTTGRKIFNGIGQFLPCIFIFSVTLTGCNQILTYVMLVGAMTTAGAIFCGYHCNHLDIASNFSGTLFGISNSIAAIPGFLGPYVVGILTQGNSTRAQWNKFFYITCGMYALSGFFFWIFGDGREQAWNKVKNNDKMVTDESEMKPLSELNENV